MSERAVHVDVRTHKRVDKYTICLPFLLSGLRAPVPRNCYVP